MTRIIVVGDIHIRDRPPVNCTDAYLPDIYAMLRHIAVLEREIDADAVVWLGDVFDFPQPGRTSHATVLRMAEIVKLYRNLWIVAGNHDTSNHVLASIREKQPLGVLFQVGAHELDGWHPTLPLFGVPWQQAWHDDEVPGEAFERWRAAGGLDEGGTTALIDLDRALAVTHAPLFPPRLAEEVIYEHVDTKLIAEAMGGVGHLAYGHIHDYHGVFTDGGVRFSNLGAISRGSLTTSNLERDIRVGIWSDGDDTYPLGFTEQVIPHAPAAEIFRIEEAGEAKEKKVKLDQFLSEMGSATLVMSSRDSVAEHIRAREAPPAVRDRAIQVIEEIAE